MTRRALACLGIVIALLLGVFGREALALCVSGNHLAIETMGHAPCRPAPQSKGQVVASDASCNDIPVGSTMEASLHGKRAVAQVPSGGDPALIPAEPGPTAGWLSTPPTAAAAPADPRLISLRTVVLLI